MAIKSFCALICFIFFSFPELSGDTKSANKAADNDYVSALSVADRFLTAWQWRRQDDGIALISGSLRKRMSEQDLRSYISGISNPHHEAFEICSGKKLDDGRMAFTIMLYEVYTGYPGVYPTGPSRLILSGDAQRGWLVDELP